MFHKSLIALTLALLGIIAYLTFRFQFDYALAAILGLVHDTIFVVGVFSILGLFYGVQIDALFVTALLTVIGFSVHDTIVVFDRVRENKKIGAGKTFDEIVDNSIWQTMRRSIFTSLTTLFTITVLYFLSVASIKEFSFPIIVGIIAGFVSSVFISGNVWVFLKNKYGKDE